MTKFWFLTKALIPYILIASVSGFPLQGQSPILRWHTFLGGPESDEGNRIAVDASGNIFVIGTSEASWGSPIKAYAGAGDAFVAKLDLNGALLWNTFLGVAQRGDYGESISVDSGGNIYITGRSYASWGSPNRMFSGNISFDVFVAKLDSNGNLLWNTFLGSNYEDYGTGIALDSVGNIYVSGYSYYSWGSPIQAFHTGGDYNGFVAKLDNSGNLLWNTFMGGLSTSCHGIVLSENGSLLVAGGSHNSWGSPINPHSLEGRGDAFVAKLTLEGIPLWHTFMGGEYNDWGYGIALDNNNIYVLGNSTATWGSPVNPGVDDDAFVAKLDSDGIFQWNTFTGAGTVDKGYGIAVTSNGTSYITGYCQMSWGSPDRQYTAAHDAFVAEFNMNGELTWNTFLGGQGDDVGNGISIGIKGEVHISGTSTSAWSSPITPFNGNGDAFITKFKYTPGPNLSALSPSSTMVGDPSFSLTALGTELAEGAIVCWDGNDRQTTFISSSELRATIDADDLTVADTVYITVRNPDGELTNSLEFLVKNYIPTLSALTPSSIRAGSPGFILAVTGSGFIEGVAVSWDGSNRPTAYISSTEARAEISAEDISNPKTVQITVHNPGTEVSSALEFEIKNPLPTLTSLVPSNAHTADPSFTLSVIGSEFVDGAIVAWDGSDRTTAFVNSNEVTTSIETADISTPRTVQVSVRNPDGGISNSLEFVISDPPAPTLTSLSPIKITGGGPSFDLTLFGANFVANSTAKWNGVDKATTFISSTELQAAILTGDISVGGDMTITVVNPIPAGSTSNVLTFSVSSFTVGSSSSSVTITAGQTAAYTIQITPQFGSFDASVNLTCAGLPRNATASLTPGSVTPGAGAAAVALSIVTRANADASTAAILQISGLIPTALILLFSILASVSYFFVAIKKPALRWISAVAFVLVLGLISNCGTKGDDGPTPNTGGTPPGTYQITVRGESGTLTASTVVTLEVR